MRIRSKRSDIPENFSIWTSFTDLMSNAFMVLTLLLLLVIANAYRANEREDYGTLFLVIRGTDYPFDSGSDKLSPELQARIRGYVVNFLENTVKQYDNSDEKIKLVIEVIGHTDGQPVSGDSSNLDEQLERARVAKGEEKKTITLKPGSNADLGLMRALAVVKELEKIQNKKNRLRGLSFRAYSAAQLILPDTDNDNDKTDKDENVPEINRNPDASRRRIEIRVTRLTDAGDLGK